MNLKTKLAKASNVTFRPIFTEQSLKQAGLNRYTFAVPVWADKGLIKKSAQKTFGVTVEGVKTIIYKGKPRRVRRSRVEKKGQSWKKAVVLVKEGQKIDLFERKEK